MANAYGQGDSIDISQIQAFAWGTGKDQVRDHALRPDIAKDSRGHHGEADELNQTSAVFKSPLQPSPSRRTTHSKQLPSSLPEFRLATTRGRERDASQIELPSTIPDSLMTRMLKMDSQSEGDTQPLSQSLYAQFNSRSKEERAAIGLSPGSLSAQENAPYILQKGDPGHIDLLAAFEEPSATSDHPHTTDGSDDDDVDPLSQSQYEHADIFPESRRFQPPKTPASQNRKRKREVEPSPSERPTPQLPVNPFAGQMGSLDGIMSASQLFQATQAATSPLTNIIPSDGLSQRPSPDIQHLQRSSTADCASSPVRLTRTDMVRAITEPQANYISMKESQEARDRLLRAKKAGQGFYPDEVSDDEFDDDPQLRRRLRQQRYNAEARDQFAKVAAQSDLLRPRKAIGGLLPPRVGTQADEPMVISDDVPAEFAQGSISEDETEREDNIEVDCQEDDIDELAEDNKENVEVPGTVSRDPNGRSQIIASQPTPSHKRGSRPNVSSPSKRTIQVLGSSQASNSRDIPTTIGVGTQPEAIADSQSSQNYANIKLHSLRPERRAFSEPQSSLDSHFLVPQSQSSQELRMPRIVSRKESTSHTLSSSLPENPGGPRQKAGTGDIRQPLPNISSPSRQTHTEGANESEQGLEETSGPQLREPQVDEPISPPNLARKSTFPESDNTETGVRTEHTVHASSSMIPSPRTTPKSVSKLPSTHSITDSSHVSTMFETAPERISNPTLKLSPARKLRRSQSTHSSPEKSRRIRSMSEIAAEPSPPDLIGEVSIDIDILSNEDREFQKVMQGSSGSAPPSRKRRRVASGSALPGLPRPLPGSPLPPPSSAISKITPVKVASIQPTPAPSSSPSNNLSPTAAKATRQVDNHSRDSSTPKPRDETRKEPIRSMISNKPKVVISSTVLRSRKKPATGTPNNVEGENSTPEKVVKVPITTTNNTPVVAPNRVFAHFNGSNPAYHPATCLEVINGDEPRYSVRFDDGTVDTISAYGIKRLELRTGDVIKVDVPGARTKSYIVKGMRDCQRPATPPDPDTPSRRGRQHSTNDAAFPETDIHGFATVLASPKQKASIDGNQSETAQEAIPLTQIYFTQTLWTSFKDRQYTHVPNRLRLFTGLQTPSERPSTPSTPSSRARRVRTSGVANSRSMTTRAQISEDLFKNMTFAITNVDRAEESKRLKDQILSNGGTILDQGFDELFNVPTLQRTTTLDQNTEESFHPASEAKDIGFACLIADKHCRRAKFIQALALGIPCLATRWISDCITKQRILPWSPYLLPSGESAFLGGAVRSRNLQPFPADSATFTTIIDNRPKLLENASVLLIMEKNQEETMKQHPLLTHALGASKVARAVNVDVAAKAVADAQAVGKPWDWVFSYDREKEVEKRLFGGGGGGGAGKKRKRGRESEGDGVGMGASAKRRETKVVGNEFVIQSLILGMLIDE